jgi:predicted peptidase
MRLLVSLLVLWAGIAAGKAWDTNEFLVRTHTNAAGQVLPYRLLPPKHYDPRQIYPVILYLHGAAARGSDNAEPLNWGPMLFLEPKLRNGHDFFLVVPQCPSNSSWVELDSTGRGLQESPPLRHAFEILEKGLPSQYRVDPKRQYITGVSMGGAGVWVAIIKRPSFFAAAVPVCAPGFPELVTRRAAQVPVWVFHSDDDHLIPVQEARSMVNAWRKQGGKPKYTECTGLKHSSWKKAYTETEMFDWLLQQQGR